MVYAPSTADLLDFANGVRRRTERFEFELLDVDYQTIGYVHPSAERAPTVSNDTSRDVYRSLDGVVLPASEQADVNTDTDRIRPWLVLENGERLPWGVYAWSNETNPIRSWGTERATSLTDLLGTLDWPRGVTTSFPKGTNLIDAAAGLARPIIGERMKISPSTMVSGAAHSWPPNTSRLQMIHDMVILCGFWPPYFDNYGWLVFRPADDPATEPDHVYSAGGRMEEDTIVGANNWLSAPNRWVVIESSGQGSPIVGIYDVPSTARNSKARIGYYRAVTKSLQGLINSTWANTVARVWAQQSKDLYEARTFSTPLDPRHDTWGLAQVLGTPGYVERSWRATLQVGGRMQHEFRRFPVDG